LVTEQNNLIIPKNTSLLIKQLFVDYAATDNLTVTAGSWTTHVGYELLDAPENDIYSMSYAFSYTIFPYRD
jgi:hypothetical protein